MLLILTRIQNDEWRWLSREVVADEIEQTPDRKRRERLQQLNKHAHKSYVLAEDDIMRAKRLVDLGFSGMDALHLVCVESGNADMFLTTDDKLHRCAKRVAAQLRVAVDNPLSWLMQQQEGGT